MLTKPPPAPNVVARSMSADAVSLRNEAIRLFSVMNPPLASGHGLLMQFIGCRRGEGVSSIAREFACIASLHVEKPVLLFDLDWTGQSQFAYFNQEKTRSHFGDPGEPVVGQANPDTLIRLLAGNIASQSHQQMITFHRIGDSQLMVSRFDRPALRVGQEVQVTHQPKLWQTLRNELSLVVIDSPPANDSLDGIAISGLMDTVVLVVEAEVTRIPVIENLRDKMLANGAHIAGVVFNKRKFYIPKILYKLL